MLLPKFRFALVKSAVSKKRSRVRLLVVSAAFFFVLLLAVAATVWIVVDRAGQSFWTRVQAEVAADGEPIDQAELHITLSAQSKRIELSNYGAIPILQDISEPWGKANRVRLESIFLDQPVRLPVDFAVAPWRPASDLKALADSLWQGVADQRALPRPLRSIPKEFPSDVLKPRDAAARIDTYLKYWQPILDELRQGIDRDVAFFEPTVDQREQFPKQRWMPHWAGISRASMALYLDALIAARSGDRDEFLLNLQTLSRLAEACANEHQLSAHYEAARIVLMLETGIVEGFRNSLFQNDPQALRKCMAMLQRFNLHSSLAPALRDEILSTTDFIGSCSTPEGYKDRVPEGVPMANMGWYPPGWFQNQQGVYLGLANAHLLKALRAGACFGDQIEAAQRFGTTLTGSLNRSHRLIVLFAFTDGMSSFHYLPACAEAYRRMAVVACALQLYAIDHDEKTPPDLSALVPDYLDKIPTDPMDGKPLRYLQSSPTEFRLWSIAFDRNDDKGHLNLTPNRGSGRVDLSFHNYTGDWPWPANP